MGREVKFQVLLNGKIFGYEILVSHVWEWMVLELNPDKGERWVYGTMENHEDLIRRQFTGLKDKKGVEMYDKDVLKVDDIDEPVVINWSDKHASFCLDKKGGVFSHFFGEACTPDQCEVIGNIYTNPELI